MTNKIIYTITDEAPALATYSLLPIIKTFTDAAGVNVETRDISVAARILSAFPENLTDEQKQADDLAELGELAKTPEANIIKLPNVSASIPQLEAAIAELQSQGYKVPNYPVKPQNSTEEEIKARYAAILGSAVNPVLREGNSDRRVAAPVKEYAKNHPHSMGEWPVHSKSHVSFMDSDDFYSNEQSHIMSEADDLKITLVTDCGEDIVLKESTPVELDEVIDATFMNVRKLREFYKGQIKDAKEKDVLLSLHLKATMMKVSDPIMFGHCVSVYYEALFDQFGSELEEIGFNPNNGIGDLYAKMGALPSETQAAIKAVINTIYFVNPELAMVDSDRGITNLHVPSDVIIDASMPAAIRASGQMWGPDGNQKDTKYMIPDRSYAKMYRESVRFHQEHGAFDVTTMGNVCNIGLMAKKAEEYGSHDKTFEIPADGKVFVTRKNGNIIFAHEVEKGDIWRMCQTKIEPIRDWIKLGVNRARETGSPAIFWLTLNRAHDRNLIKLVNKYLPTHDTDGLDIRILPPSKAMRESMNRAKDGLDTISVTGNVLRDYLTDLFPILELGTSAKMLSIVPLLKEGGLFETGAGGSAPKHVQQFEKEGHLRWDSLGEFLALKPSLNLYHRQTGNDKAKILENTLVEANAQFLENNKSPSRKVNELDNRGSHFYLAMYWAQAMAAQNDDAELKAKFAPVAEQLTANEEKIVAELNDAQGSPQDVGGYFHPDSEKAAKAMRPSETLNAILASV